VTSIEQSPCKREVRVQDGNRWKVYVARFASEGVYMREKGKRTEYGPTTWGVILLRGVQGAAIERIENKPARRKRVSRNLLG
jgi:hypothetical protein